MLEGLNIKEAQDFKGVDCHLVDEDYVFIYNCERPYPIYVIVPDKGKTTVHHQHNCNCCSQFEQKNCALYAGYGEAAEEIEEVLSPCDPDPHTVRVAIQKWMGPGADLRYVNEGLAECKAEDGTTFYIACLNCD